jgi:hypothetical protein
MTERLSVFSRIKQLFPATGFPEEDYLTELVATIIERHSKEFIEWLRELGITEFESNAVVTVTTQYHCAKNPDEETPEKYPDIMVRLDQDGAEEIIFIESKVKSDLSGPDQLQQYARILSALSASKKTLLFITRDYLPQQTADVLAKILPAREPPEFVSKRWHDFARYFSDGVDPLTKELIEYMKAEKLTQDRQFTPNDAAAIVGFPHALSLMRTVLDDDMRARLSTICGALMDEMDMEVQIVRWQICVLRNRLKTRNIGVTLGFWLGAGDDGFPVVYGDITFERKPVGKEDIIAAMLKFAANKKDEWQIEDVSPTSNYGRIFRERSLASFLGQKDHVAAVRDYLHDVIADIAEFKKIFPKLIWTI